jgi:hypothetical protein
MVDRSPPLYSLQRNADVHHTTAAVCSVKVAKSTVGRQSSIAATLVVPLAASTTKSHDLCRAARMLNSYAVHHFVI